MTVMTSVSAFSDFGSGCFAPFSFPIRRAVVPAASSPEQWSCGAASGQAKPLAAHHLIQAAHGARASERQASKPSLPPPA
jgi:hypothetical protein